MFLKAVLGLFLSVIWIAGTIAAPLGPNTLNRQRGTKTTQEYKAYFNRFGHWRRSRSNATSDDDDDLKESVRKFQAFFRLPLTGEVDKDTEDLVNTPRCGVPDNDVSPNRRRRFVLWGTKWPMTSLRFRIENYTPDLNESVARRDLLRSFQSWSNVSRLTFIESSSSPNIRVKFASGDHGDGQPFDGRGGVLAHTFFPPNGGVHFDEDENWTHESPSGTNLYQVATHEVGHALGLAHSRSPAAVMYPYYNGYRRNFALDADDIAGIRALYGAPINSAPPSPTFPTSVSRGITDLRPSTSTTTSRTNTVKMTIPVTTITTTTTTIYRPRGRCRVSSFWRMFGWC